MEEAATRIIYSSTDKRDYLRDDRHILNLPLTKENIKMMVPCRQKRELDVLADMIAIENVNRSNYYVGKQILGRTFMMYIITNGVSGFGAYINPIDNQTVYLSLRDLDYKNMKDNECLSIKQAIVRTGNISKYLKG